MIEEKLIKQCMIWHHKVFGIGLILLGVWWYLKNIGVVPETIFWPVIVIAVGIACLAEVNSLWKKL